MKQLSRCLLIGLCILMPWQVIQSNPIEVKFISEVLLQGQDSGEWIIELDLRIDSPNNIDGWFLTTATDTAYMNPGLTPDSTGFLLIRRDSLQSELTLSGTGETITLFHEQGYYLDQVRFGDVIDAQISVPLPGQSMCLGHGWQYFWCIDNTPTLGEENDEDGTIGTISGYIYSSSGSPLADAWIVFEYMPWGSDSLYVVADSEGLYVIENTAKHTDLFVNSPGFTSQLVELQVWPDSTGEMDFFLSPLVGIDDKELQVPEQLELMQNYPNPFNASTSIQFGLPSDGHVSIDVLKLDGGHIASMINENMPVGLHTVIWEAADTPSGVYFYKLQFGDKNISRKMILLK